MALLFQDIQRGTIVSSESVTAAMAAGMVVHLSATGWETADDETEANGILMVDVVAAETSDADGYGDVYADGITQMPAKVYVGKPAPVDVGNCVCLVPNLADESFTVGGKVYVGAGFLYATAQNSGSAVGTVLDTDAERVKVSFKFVV